MNTQPHLQGIALPIATVERDTGLSKDTLRVWERRYGFPTPARDAFGDRTYPLEQLEKLRVIKRLIDAGHRPGRIAALGMDALQALSSAASSGGQDVNSPARADLAAYLAFVQSHDSDRLRKALSQAITEKGLAAFVCDVVAPLTTLVGDGWMRGELQVFEEHLYTECIQAVLHRALLGLASPTAHPQPRVLLTTFPNEQHALGLLMAQVMLRLQGSACVSLGTQTPLADMVTAAAAHRSDIVALSFTASLNAKDVTQGLAQLRQLLPAHVQVWAGGQCPALDRNPVAGITRMQNLQDIGAAVTRWRAG